MFKKHRIFGVEQQANVAALAIVNMIFRGDGKNNIINNDCLSLNLNRKIRNNEVSAEYQTKIGDRKPVTKVLMNPPFALHRDNEQEFIFIEHALLQMVEGGLLLCIVPISVMYAAGNDLEWRRRTLRGNSLLAVISFSSDLFYPQATVETAIIVIKKGVPHTVDSKTLFVRITDDGFIKLKRRRLRHKNKSQLYYLLPEIKSFIFGGECSEEIGIIQALTIDMSDRHLELIPQQYLSPSKIGAEELKFEVNSVHSEVLFCAMRGDKK